MSVLRCTRILGKSLRTQAHAGTSALIDIPSRRTFSSSPTLLKYVRRPRNEEIKYKTVQCVNTEGKLRPPEPLSDILKDVNINKYFVELVQDNPPVVKIINRKEAHEARKAMKEREKAAKTDHKEIQMTWGVTETDLTRKLIKARQLLERNNLVDIAFVPKSKKFLPGLKTLELRMQGTVDALKDIAVERQQRTLLRGVGVLYFRLDKSKVENKD